MYKFLFLLLVTFFIIAPYSYAKGKGPSPKSSDPKLSIDYSDVKLFYATIEEARQKNIPITGKYLYENYLTKASPGLQKSYVKNRTDMFPQRDGAIDFEKYNAKIETLLPFFEKNKDIFLQEVLSEQQVQQIGKDICRFLGEQMCNRLLKDKVVYYSISGGFNMGGTAFEDGIFLDRTMVYGENVDYSLLPENEQWAAKNTMPSKENHYSMVAHEFFHTFQQLVYDPEKDSIAQYKGPNLKHFALVEGAANFFATQVIPKDKQFGQKKEQQYMQQNPQKYIEFSQDIQRASQVSDRRSFREIAGKWFYNRESQEVQDGLYPEDLGYYIGQEISRAFFEQELQAGNSREAALNKLLRLKISDNMMERILQSLAADEIAVNGKDQRP